MESVASRLQQVGLTEYEAKAYLSLLSTHLSTATEVSEISGIPRTKIYQVLESLQRRVWVRIYSGIPLLFKAVEPLRVFEKVKEDFSRLLESVKATLKKEVNDMKEKFVVKKFDIGLEELKTEIRKAKTVEINNATTSFVKIISDAFRKDAVLRVLMFPGEEKAKGLRHADFKEAEVAIVSIVRNKEVPSVSIILDESRTFTIFQDPVDQKYIVDEMLYDECSRCFAGWSSMSWNSTSQT